MDAPGASSFRLSHFHPHLLVTYRTWPDQNLEGSGFDDSSHIQVQKAQLIGRDAESHLPTLTSTERHALEVLELHDWSRDTSHQVSYV